MIAQNVRVGRKGLDRTATKIIKIIYSAKNSRRDSSIEAEAPKGAKRASKALAFHECGTVFNVSRLSEYAPEGGSETRLTSRPAIRIFAKSIIRSLA